tara:strand:- start:298 stop:582 length:285 start_codon:yes stop_codon:yes gene_type:complete
MTVKQLWADYKAPIPKLARQIGDILLIVAGIGGVLISMLTTLPQWVGVTITLIGLVGKLLSNFKAPKTPKEVLDIVSRLPRIVKDFKDATNKKL